MVKKEFHLTHTFKNVSKLEDGKTLYGPEEEHFNIPWQLSFCRKEEFVGVFLRCLRPTDGIVPWEINADCILKLTSSAGKCLSHSSTYIFQSIGGFGRRKFVSWDTLVKDHLVNDSIIMEATVMITKMTGISKKKLRSFEKSEEQFSDVVLAVEDKKFFVLRKFLASHSSYFKSLLLGTFAEADKSEIKHEAINSIDFQNFLEVLYGEPVIDDDDVEGILHLAHMYDVPVAIRKCEEFLIEKSEKSMRDQLEIAKKYQLDNLKKSCLSKVNTVEEIKAALMCDLADMDPTVVAALFRKSLALL
ncbi:BTB domain-containing protein [Caenorhabditis elegans]|uniref:BTB domain-containing protein n=1 Tax=Caenorhabditis elegans TaxID=6239 RepID=Q9N5Q0_CAEEL|nr:BTB domain-containing protein [Caenorhabditis elegans]CCD61289.1 BTB domain-containing protein [Caenorhabditis elegans]|eukprot:NP_494156.1 BTB and MATH domain containing [Caenorhabditis elegans]